MVQTKMANIIPHHSRYKIYGIQEEFKDYGDEVVRMWTPSNASLPLVCGYLDKNGQGNFGSLRTRMICQMWPCHAEFWVYVEPLSRYRFKVIVKDWASGFADQERSKEDDRVKVDDLQKHNNFAMAAKFGFAITCPSCRKNYILEIFRSHSEQFVKFSVDGYNPRVEFPAIATESTWSHSRTEQERLHRLGWEMERGQEDKVLERILGGSYYY